MGSSTIDAVAMDVYLVNVVMLGCVRRIISKLKLLRSKKMIRIASNSVDLRFDSYIE